MEYKLASSTWDHKEVDAIHRVIESDMYSMGAEVSYYEREFAEFFGSSYAVMTSSGSTANLLMIASLFFTKNPRLKLKRGDEVIVPAVSWSTTYFPLQQYGLHVKFVDIDKDTLNIDISKLADAISVKTKVIFLVNLLGNPCDFTAIERLVEGRDITILEDNCESMGAELNGIKAGNFGVMGTFSSFFSHHIATMEGGCIITDDEELYHLLLCLRAHGWTRNLPERNWVTGRKNSNSFDESFKFVLPGYNVRPIEMSGAIGREQLKKLTEFINVRRKNASFFFDVLSNNPFISLQRETGKSSWFGFSILLNDESAVCRADLVKELSNKGIECRPIVTGNFLKNREVLEFFDYSIAGSTPNAEYIEERGLFVGNHQVDLSQEINYLREVLDNFLVGH